jgi:uncharacterized membrane protein YbhN (UPF0104 family)
MSTSETATPAGPPTVPLPATVVREPPLEARVRRPLDGVRLALALLGAVLTVLVAVTAERTVAGLEGDISEATGLLPSWLTNPLGLVSALATVTIWFWLVGAALARRDLTVAAELVGAWLLGIVVVGAVSRLLTQPWLPDTLVAAFRPVSSAGVPLDASVAGIVALISVVGVGERPWLQRLAWLGVGGSAAAAVFAGATTLQGMALSLLLGRAVGLGVRLAVGVPSARVSGTQIAAALAGRGVDLDVLQYRGGSWPRRYTGHRGNERFDVVVLDRDQQGAGVVGRLWRWLRLRDEVLPQDSVTMRAATAQRALAGLAFQEAGVRVPPTIAVLPVGPEATTIVRRMVPSTPLAELAEQGPLDDAVLDEVWAQVQRMRSHSLAHLGITGEQLRVDPNGRVWVTGGTAVEVAASPLALATDVAQTLVATAAVVGPERAVDAAVRGVGRKAVVEALPLVQPLTLPAATRKAIKSRRRLLEEIREAVLSGGPPAEEPSDLRIERLRPRALLTALSAIVAVSLVGGQLAGVDVLGVVRSAQPLWALVAILAFAATYVGAAWGLLGFVTETLPLRRVVVTQVSLSFVRLLAPTTLGATAVNLRMLTRSGVSAPAAATAVAASQAAAALVGVPIVVALAVSTGRSFDLGIRPSTLAVTIGAVVVATVVVLALVPAARRRGQDAWQAFLQRGLPRLLDAVQDPKRLGMAMGGNVILTVGYGLSLWACVQALGVDIPLGTALLVYLSGNAVGSIVPTPGGLGAVEAAMVAGLTAAGVAGAVAVPAVLLFRVITFWAPIPLGWLALSSLQKRNLV